MVARDSEEAAVTETSSMSRLFEQQPRELVKASQSKYALARAMIQGTTMANVGTSEPISPGVRIGHVHLKVADLDRAIRFYRDVLGFELTQRLGDSAAFLSAGGYHHHIGLNTWESEGGSWPARGTTGLFHLAILYPSRAELATALRRLIEARIPLEGASDHGVSEALYLRDPDGNGIELYWDRPRDQWPRTPEGELAMFTARLDLEDLARATPGEQR
jgi:catechol 2,3-dioxygenase